MSKIHVSSEIGNLRKVIVHRPDRGIARVSPRRAEELLFDDIVFLPKMQEEHDVFTSVLKRFIGDENVLETQDLLKESLDIQVELKEELIDMAMSFEELPSSTKKTLMDLTSEKLAKVLITGYYPEEKHILFDPIPNFIFTRDIAVTVNDHIIITKASKEARARENLLTRFIIHAHPVFKSVSEANKVINLNMIDDFPPSKRNDKVSIEGGDVMIINKDYLLIGISERTTRHAIESLAKVLFEKKIVSNVAMIDVPNERSFMHIDTLFTQITATDFVGYKPIVVDGHGSNVEVLNQSGKVSHYWSIEAFLKAEINPKARVIHAGQGLSPYQEREQWTDGCNLVALKPGVALTYDRNIWTEKAFKEAGYRVVHAVDLLKAFDDGILTPDEVKNTIITLPSTELSRARGGSHCMTCPIQRDKI
jgi:arginine deiminase